MFERRNFMKSLLGFPLIAGFSGEKSKAEASAKSNDSGGKLIEVDLDRIGRGTLVVDGKDISRMTNGICVISKVGEATQVHVSLIGNIKVKTQANEVFYDDTSIQDEYVKFRKAD